MRATGLLITVCQVALFGVQRAFASTSANANSNFRDGGVQLLNLILSGSEVSGDVKRKFQKYVGKVTKAAEAESSAEEFMQVYDKYYAKIMKLVQELPSENLVVIFESVNAFLNDLKQAYAPAGGDDWDAGFADIEAGGLKSASADEMIANFTLKEVKIDSEKKESTQHTIDTSDDQYFIERLREFPEGSAAALYAYLWTTLNEVDDMQLNRDEKVLYIDSAVKYFSREFYTVNRRNFAAELADPSIFNANFASMHRSFDTTLNKIGDIVAGTQVDSESDSDA